MTAPSFRCTSRQPPFAGRVLAIALSASAIGAGAADAPPAAAPDPVVVALLKDISAERIAERIRTLAAFETRHTASETASDTRGIGAARRWIERELGDCSARAGGRLEVSTQSWEEPAGRGLAQPTMLVNVIATLPGADPVSRDRLLLVSGHCDSRATDLMDATGPAPGANDDASGTAIAIELACTMARQRFEATLVFMAVAGEEQGLLGAAHFAQDARRRGLGIEAMVTNDIVGSPVGDAGQRDAKRLRLFVDGFDPLLRLLPQAQASRPARSDDTAGEREASAGLQAIALAGGAQDLPAQQFGRHLKAAAERYLPGFTVQLIQRRDRYLRGGDHLPFLERGYAAVRFTEPFEDFRHQHQSPRTEAREVYGDLVEFVDFGFVADVARVNAAGLATLALAPAPPREVRLDASQLTNDSTLQWAAADDPLIAGYRVVWRDTGSATWQHARDVGRVDRVTLPGVSKDNVVFGVQAVSKRGHASLASFPLTLRR
jgi:Peptidase family M28